MYPSHKKFGACTGCAVATDRVRHIFGWRGFAFLHLRLQHKELAWTAKRPEVFCGCFGDLPDPRAHNVIHKLHDILVIAICAVVCGANGWAEVEQFGNSKQSWFRTFLDLPSGIPSHDTFGRVFARLSPDAFERCFVAWTSSLPSVSGGKLIAIDGKAIRRSFEHAWDKSGMTHLVSAFVDANHIVFGQVAVADKSNEIDAIPRLLSLLDLAGATVTIDAIGCQTEIAQQIVEAEGDYVLAAKRISQRFITRSRRCWTKRSSTALTGCVTTPSSPLMGIMAASRHAGYG